MSAEQQAGARPGRVPWAAVVVFSVVATGLAWVVALPLWLGELPPLLAQAVVSAMMFTPALAVLVVVLVLRAPRRGAVRFLGLWPLRPVGRTIWFCVLGLLAPLVLTFAGIAVSAAFGWVELDLAGLSGFVAANEAAGADLSGIDPWLLVSVQLVMVPFAAVIPNAILAFGEEIGWRGWLLPSLRPLGVWPALLITGAVWGVWHAPVLLLGQNYARTDVTGVLFMVVACVLLGVFFGWLRLRTGSVWPAVFAHGGLNAVGSATLLFSAAGSTPDPVLMAPMGVPMWIVLGAVIAVLALCGQFRAARLVGFAPRPAG
ncbi:CPBP family intramembrane glutamic endopeptidase [Microbacterium halophytorum]|uniref:CPBP family intramembrane glutamic endopeptidase n=1 Tax=Microbacterium halophytorum TaxID=2067568 RepID=UPI000CFC0D8E|nr:CPBP family intramembrane glutamic endopeptidase [Microbacterium halophytorum]